MKRIIQKFKVKTHLAPPPSLEEKIREQILERIKYGDEVSIANIFSRLDHEMRFDILNPQNPELISAEEDPFMYAITKGLTYSVNLFLPYIRNINRKTHDYGTALHAACDLGLKDIIYLLLSKPDLDLNSKKPWLYETPLQTIIRCMGEKGVNNSVFEATLTLMNDPRCDLNAVGGYLGQVTALSLFQKFANKRQMPAQIGEILSAAARQPDLIQRQQCKM